MPATVLDDLRAVERLLAGLPPESLREITANPALAEELGRPWRPNPGPQTAAYECLADELLYGGQGGGGKSGLLLGLALTRHRRSLVMRRQYTDLRALTERVVQINGTRKGFNGASPPMLRTENGRRIEFGAAAHLGDEHSWQGQPHDFLGIDEAAQFLEEQIRFLIGWVRSTEKGQRCRVVLATNPPLSDEGQFLNVMFAPWLDQVFPDPAKPGELRWYIYDPKARKDRWVDGAGEHRNDAGQAIEAKSRTMIPASVQDNPDMVDAGYQRTLDNLPEPLRSAIRDGNFMAGREDDEFQIIPTAWVQAAQARWLADGWRGLRMTAIGIDVAQGGADKTVLAPRYGCWYAPLIEKPGVDTPDGPTVAGLITMHRRDAAAVVVDVGGGYGGAVVSYLKDNDTPVAGFNGANATLHKTRDGSLGFVNKRAEAYWRLREALDPGQEGGSPLALPPDQGLTGDLAASRWKLTPRGIQVEAKEDIKKRLGRSPDKADAVVMAWSEGEALAERKLRFAARGGQPLTANVGYAAMKKRWRQ